MKRHIKNTSADDLSVLSSLGDAIEEREVTPILMQADLENLMCAAKSLRDQRYGSVISYSRKVFIPLTQLCRDSCHYCTFAQPPRKNKSAYLLPDEVLKIANAGAKAGCKEALFTLGDKPELRYKAARDELASLGHKTTISYLAECAQLVFEKTGLFPHMNPGLLDRTEILTLRDASISQGIMLESISEKLSQKGGPHYGSPDKNPMRRLETIRLAGEENVAFTSGLLIGIGETRRDRIASLFALLELHRKFGHVQEIIIQNFRPKPSTRMANYPPATLEELLWTIAVARIIFGEEMNIQAPPNLSPGVLASLVDAGVNDWGGVSPITPDHVNPEAPWPQLDDLSRETEAAGKILVERLALYPEYVQDGNRWLSSQFKTPVKQLVNAEGFPRKDEWSPGAGSPPQAFIVPPSRGGQSTWQDHSLEAIIEGALVGDTPNESEIIRLFSARGTDFAAVCTAADTLRRNLVGDEVTFVVNRNINYTNVCYYRCQFCAFSKGKMSENLRGKPYRLEIEEIQRRALEAWDRGATEVCMQGGIHPEYTGKTYIDICRAIKSAVPDMHVHAFSPLEIFQGAQTAQFSVPDFLKRLIDAGLGSLPGTAAEILDDEIRAVICPDKIKTDQWLEVMGEAHELGIPSTATIMFGHVEKPIHWARHLLRLLNLQKRTGGFTEFVLLPFVHMEAPIFLKGGARQGPTFRETVLMHAVARLVFHKHIPNIQTSWVKLGPAGVKFCLETGANDVGGTLMSETITRSAGATYGQEMTPERVMGLINDLGRIPKQRTTLYKAPPNERRKAGLNVAALETEIFTLASRYERGKSTKKEPIRPGLEA